MNASTERIKEQNGTALVLAIIVLGILSVLIIAFSKDIAMDLDISRNISMRLDAFNMAEAVTSITEELIADSAYNRCPDTSLSTPVVDRTVTLNAATYTVRLTVYSPSYCLYSNPGGNGTTGTVTLLNSSGATLGTANVDYLEARATDGSSIIIAAGYEGVGKGAGASVGTSLYYKISVSGVVTKGGSNSTQRIEEIYRYVVGS